MKLLSISVKTQNTSTDFSTDLVAKMNVFLYPEEIASLSNNNRGCDYDQTRTSHVREVLKAKAGDNIRIASLITAWEC